MAKGAKGAKGTKGAKGQQVTEETIPHQEAEEKGEGEGEVGRVQLPRPAVRDGCALASWRCRRSSSRGAMVQAVLPSELLLQRP
jgi:hypothetical protein